MKNRKSEIIGSSTLFTAGLISGAKIGAKYGIATGGKAMAGTIPGAIILGTTGLLAGSKIGSEFDRNSERKNAKNKNNNFDNRRTASSRKYGRGRV